MTSYRVEIVDEGGQRLYWWACQADDDAHAREQAKDSLGDGEHVGRLVAVEDGGSLYDSGGAAVKIWESEREAGYVHPDLDLDYVDGLAADLAAILQTDVAEAVYQPGDGTRYPLVIVPLAILRAGRPRMKNGVAWERHAVSGMVGLDALEREAEDGSGYYGEGGYLVSWVERSCYQTRLQDRDLAAVYVAEHWGCSLVSACSLAILLRAVGHYLDKWDEAGRSRSAHDRRDRIRTDNAERRDG